MRGLPFFKPKNKPQFAGLNFSNDTSGGGGGTGSGGVNFSTSEFATNCKWLDGKDIFGITLNVTVADTYTNINIADIITNNDVVGIAGMYKNNDDIVPINWYLDSSYNVSTKVSMTNKQLNIHKGISGNLTGDVTIFYTKNS